MSEAEAQDKVRKQLRTLVNKTVKDQMLELQTNGKINMKRVE